MDSEGCKSVRPPRNERRGCENGEQFHQNQPKNGNVTTSGVFTPDDATEMVNDLPLQWAKGPYYDEFSDQPPSQDPVPESEHKAENGERCTDSGGVPLRR